MRRTEHYTFFFTKNDVFSNWHPSRFEYRGVQFGCMEQFMMYAKARLFNDLETAQKILKTADPQRQKALGREVRGYVDAIWVQKRESIVAVGVREKFAQNPGMLEQLLSTQGTALVEASKFDRIWGCGLAETDPRVEDETQWPGMNLLGKVLDRVRDHFLAMTADRRASLREPSSSPRTSSRPGLKP